MGARGDPEGLNTEQDDGNMFEMHNSILAEEFSTKRMIGPHLAKAVLSTSIMIELD
jgi:hypothetical protein